MSRRLLILVASVATVSAAFSIQVPTAFGGVGGASSEPFALFSTPRQPRRNLKKRRNRRREAQERLRNGGDTTQEDAFWETAEIRSLISSQSREAGEDYWIDEKDLQEELARKEAIKNRKAMEGEMPKEKLWTEVFAPYKQNWIGIFSMVIFMLATVVIKFPELLNSPVIPIPDL